MNTKEILKIIAQAAKDGGLSRFSDMKSLMYFLCQNFNLNASFIRQYKDVINWKKISTEQDNCIDTNFIREFKDYLNWNYFGKYSRYILTEEQRKEFQEYFSEKK